MDLLGNMTFYQNFGLRLRAARKEAGYTQEDLAKALELTRTSVANMEKGRQKILLHTFHRLLLVLNLQPDQLLPSDATGPEKGMALDKLTDRDRSIVEKAIGRTNRGPS